MKLDDIFLSESQTSTKQLAQNMLTLIYDDDANFDELPKLASLIVNTQEHPTESAEVLSVEIFQLCTKLVDNYNRNHDISSADLLLTAIEQRLQEYLSILNIN